MDVRDSMHLRLLLPISCRLLLCILLFVYDGTESLYCYLCLFVHLPPFFAFVQTLPHIAFANILFYLLFVRVFWTLPINRGVCTGGIC